MVLLVWTGRETMMRMMSTLSSVVCAVCSALSRGALALFVETTSTTVDAVSAFSRTLAVPLITPAGPVGTPPPPLGRRTDAGGRDAAVAVPVQAPPPAAGGDRSSYVLFMRPPYHQVLADVVLHYSWSRVFYLYDNGEGTYTVTERSWPGRPRRPDSLGVTGEVFSNPTKWWLPPLPLPIAVVYCFECYEKHVVCFAPSP